MLHGMGEYIDLMWRFPPSSTWNRRLVISSPSRIHFTSGFGEPKTLQVNSIDCPLTVAKSVGASSMSGARAYYHFTMLSNCNWSSVLWQDQPLTLWLPFPICQRPQQLVKALLTFFFIYQSNSSLTSPPLLSIFVSKITIASRSFFWLFVSTLWSRVHWFISSIFHIILPVLFNKLSLLPPLQLSCHAIPSILLRIHLPELHSATMPSLFLWFFYRTRNTSVILGPLFPVLLGFNTYFPRPLTLLFLLISKY